MNYKDKAIKETNELLCSEMNRAMERAAGLYMPDADEQEISARMAIELREFGHNGQRREFLVVDGKTVCALPFAATDEQSIKIYPAVFLS